MNKSIESQPASLTLKQKLFVDYYCGECRGNATAAAEKAGYSQPTASGSENLRKPVVQEAIRERFASVAMQADEALSLLARQARASLADALEWKEHTNEQGETKRYLVLSLEKATETGLIHCVASAKYGPNGLELKLADAQGALDKILRGLGVYQNDGSGVTVVIKNYVGGDLREMV